MFLPLVTCPSFRFCTRGRRCRALVDAVSLCSDQKKRSAPLARNGVKIEEARHNFEQTLDTEERMPSKMAQSDLKSFHRGFNEVGGDNKHTNKPESSRKSNRFPANTPQPSRVQTARFPQEGPRVDTHDPHPIAPRQASRKNI